MSEVSLYTTGTAFKNAKETLVCRGHSTMARSYTARGVVRASYRGYSKLRTRTVVGSYGRVDL